MCACACVYVYKSISNPIKQFLYISMIRFFYSFVESNDQTTLGSLSVTYTFGSSNMASVCYKGTKSQTLNSSNCYTNGFWFLCLNMKTQQLIEAFCLLHTPTVLFKRGCVSNGKGKVASECIILCKWKSAAIKDPEIFSLCILSMNPRE